MRAGAHVLLMATDPVNRAILRELAERPLGIGNGTACQITSGGREALFAGFVAERWLQACPQGPLRLASREAARAIAALAEAWSATVVHLLARGPLTLGELHGAIDGLDRRSLQRQLAAMQGAGQIEVASGEGDGAVYALTDWGRVGIAPLIASARLERRNPMEGMAPIDALDVEAGFRLSLALVELPKQLSGTCSLGLNLDDEENASLTGVTARIEAGQMISCEAGLDEKADAWAAATAADWLDAVIEADPKRIRAGGDRWLTRALVDGLHRTLFGVPVA
jgi:DNA-binding HxlR family transcriptional regulator